MSTEEDKEITFTFRVNAVLKDSFVQTAKKTDRSASQLLRDFMREYVKQDNEQKNN